MRAALLLFAVAAGLAADKRFVIRILDSQTGRGVPLVELRAFNQRAWYSDSNGIVAVADAWAMGRDVFFQVRSHGYRFDKRAFDEPGIILPVKPGGRAELRMVRENIAERLYRITGAGIYADSVAAGAPVPIRQPLLNGKVTGQDTVIAIPYRGRIYWFWGDTFGPAHMNFNVSGATSLPPGAGGLDPDRGVDLDYFVGHDGFSRPMLPLDRPGPVWLEGLMIVRDPQGRDRLVATYTRVNKTNAVEERGVALFDDNAQVFRVLAQHPPDRGHRSSHPVRVEEGGRAWWYLYPNYRVLDDWNAIQNARAYEGYTCDAKGCAWKPGAGFVDGAEEERKLMAGGKLPAEAMRFPLIDVDTGKPASLSLGSIAWNAYRRRWIMIAGFWGDVYYSEAAAPEGPWSCAEKIVRHEKYNFYNVVHHAFFDKDGGRVIYFEGTYSTTFINGAQPTPLYDYNQIMYKLSLDDPRLTLPPVCVERK
jgi:hypothetical protein